MNEETVDKIAEYLGITVDKVGEFIAYQLPQYAQLRALNDIAVCIFILIFLLVSIIIFYKVRRLKIDCGNELEQLRINKEQDGRKLLDLADKKDTLEVVTLITFIFSLFFGLVFAISAGLLVTDAIGWLCYPEAKLIDTVIYK